MAKTNLVQSVMIPLSKIESNKGQIVGLPKNPRLIRDEKFTKLKKSIEEDIEMTALRELLVIEHDGKYVIIGGNMRFRAMQDLGIKEAPCKVIPADTDVEKLKAYTIKDNAGFGEWDWDDLANEWNAEQLSNWGVDVWESEAKEEDYGTEFALNDGDKSPFQQMTFLFANEQAEFIKTQLELSKAIAEGETFGNTNPNGNAIYNIVRQWADAKK